MKYILSKPVLSSLSPNYVEGRSEKVKSIVIHKSEGSLESCLSWFANPSSKVSSHYVIGLDGSVHCCVEPENTAWHAGVVVSPSADSYSAGDNPNNYTVGIELEGYAIRGTPNKQLAALYDLVADLCMEFALVPSPYSLAFHRDFDKAKSCPGAWIDRNSLILISQQTMYAVLAGALPVPPGQP